MNEKIIKLSQQAGFKTSWQHPDVYKLKIERLEFFVKSIVEECASKVDFILAEGGKTQGDLIREHFGFNVGEK
jgi:hypothetical protein